MKLYFSLLLIICSMSIYGHTDNLIVITYEDHPELAFKAKEILTLEFKYPQELIELKNQSSNCNPIKNAILHLCIDKLGEITLPIIKKDILSQAFNIFRAE